MRCRGRPSAKGKPTRKPAIGVLPRPKRNEGRAPPGGDDRRSDWCPPRPLPGGRMQRLVEPGEAVRRGSGMMLAPKALVPSYDTFLRVLQWKPKRNRSPPCRGSGCLLASCMFPLSSLSFSCLMSLSASGFFSLWPLLGYCFVFFGLPAYCWTCSSYFQDLSQPQPKNNAKALSQHPKRISNQPGPCLRQPET